MIDNEDFNAVRVSYLCHNALTQMNEAAGITGGGYGIRTRFLRRPLRAFNAQSTPNIPHILYRFAHTTVSECYL